MKDKIRKVLRRWWKKLCLNLAAVAKIDSTNKTVKLAAVSVAIATVAATANAQIINQKIDGGNNTFDNQNTGGYFYSSSYRDWSVWGSIWGAMKTPWVWMSGLGGLSRSFDSSPDPGQTYYRGGRDGQ